jgi:hypothetical protein
MGFGHGVPPPSGYFNIGLGEIVAFEEQRHAQFLRTGVREAIAHVQFCGVTAFAEARERQDGFRPYF